MIHCSWKKQGIDAKGTIVHGRNSIELRSVLQLFMRNGIKEGREIKVLLNSERDSSIITSTFDY